LTAETYLQKEKLTGNTKRLLRKYEGFAWSNQKIFMSPPGISGRIRLQKPSQMFRIFFIDNLA
jgi:hypothetical protein